MHYIPKEASLPPDAYSLPHTNKADYFDDVVKLNEQLERHLEVTPIDEGNPNDIEFPPLDIDHPDAPQDLTAFLDRYPGVYSLIQRFLSLHMFCYLKFFDHELPDDAPDNFYFEREWRVCGNLQFNLQDVRRVLIPEEYAERFRQDLPEYYGQVNFTD